MCAAGKRLFIAICLQFVYGEIFSQSPHDSAVFAYDFLHLHLEPDTPLKFHFVYSYEYKEDPNAGKRTEDYQYIHNGDPFKGAEDIFSSSIDGAGWLKNFDFGKFASVIFEVRGDNYNDKSGFFDWTGKLLFINLFHKKQTGDIKHKRRLREEL
jgi:hypothetical protein